MVVRRMLSCGVNYKEFDTARKNLSDEQQKVIYNIARRMWVTHTLRYLTEIKVSVFGPGETVQLELFDIPALEVYLLFTCIDALANKNHCNFYEWLKGQIGKDEALNIETIKILYYKQYEPTKGIGANIRRLLENLPEQTQQWLSEHIKIQKLDRRVAKGEQIDGENVFVEVRDTNEVISELYKYFYNTRRNLFTHQSQSLQTYREEDIEIRDRWRFTPTTDNYRKDRRYTYSLRIKEGLDEATILRVIIQSAVLQEMKIPVQASTIRDYISNQSRLCAIYGFLKEIRQNSLYLRVLNDFDENGISELNNLIHDSGIPNLRSQWAPILIDRLDAGKPLERGLKQSIGSYLNNVTQLNSLIDEFNSSFVPPKKRSDDEYNKAVKEFLTNQSKTPLFKDILKMPSRVEMENLELLVGRDPCYT